MKHYEGAPHVKAMYMLTTLHDWVSDILQEAPKGHKITDTTEDQFRDQQVAAEYCNHLKIWAQYDGESWQAFAIAIEQVTTIPFLLDMRTILVGDQSWHLMTEQETEV
jgi:hypothetical protein